MKATRHYDSYQRYLRRYLKLPPCPPKRGGAGYRFFSLPLIFVCLTHWAISSWTPWLGQGQSPASSSTMRQNQTAQSGLEEEITNALQRVADTLFPQPRRKTSATSPAAGLEATQDIRQLEIAEDFPEPTSRQAVNFPIQPEGPEAALFGVVAKTLDGKGYFLSHIVRVTRSPESGDLQMAVLSLEAGDFKKPATPIPGQQITLLAPWETGLVKDPGRGKDLLFPRGSLRVTIGTNYGDGLKTAVVLSSPSKQLPEFSLIPLRASTLPGQALMRAVPGIATTLSLRDGKKSEPRPVTFYRIGQLARQPKESIQSLREENPPNTTIMLYAATAEELKQLASLEMEQGVHYDLVSPVPSNLEMAEDFARQRFLTASVTMGGISVKDTIVPVGFPDKPPEGGRPPWPAWANPDEPLVMGSPEEVNAGQMSPAEYATRAIRVLSGGPSHSASRVLSQLSQPPVINPTEPSGLKIFHVSRVGEGDSGEELRASLRDLGGAGVNVNGMRTAKGSASAHTLVLLRSDGTRNYIHDTGASDSLTSKNFGKEQFQTTVLGLFGSELGEKFMPGVLDVLREAHKAGQIVFWDTVVDPFGHWEKFSDSEFRDILSLTHVFTASAGEARTIMRLRQKLKPADAEKLSPQEIAKYFMNRGSKAVFLKLDDKGSFIQTTRDSVFGEEITLRMPVLKGVTVVDGTGTGDAFSGAVIMGYLMGWPVEKTARFATATGGLVVQNYGGTLGESKFHDVLQATQRLKNQQDVQEALATSANAAAGPSTLRRGSGHAPLRAGLEQGVPIALNEAIKALAQQVNTVQGHKVTVSQVSAWLIRQPLADLWTGRKAEVFQWLRARGAAQAYGMDPALPRKLVRRNPNLLRQKLQDRWPFRDDQLRVVLSSYVLGVDVPHVDKYKRFWGKNLGSDYAKIARELERTLSPDGLAMPNLMWVGNSRLKDRLQSVGLRVKEAREGFWFVTKKPLNRVLRQIANEITSATSLTAAGLEQGSKMRRDDIIENVLANAELGRIDQVYYPAGSSTFVLRGDDVRNRNEVTKAVDHATVHGEALYLRKGKTIHLNRPPTAGLEAARNLRREDVQILIATKEDLLGRQIRAEVVKALAGSGIDPNRQIHNVRSKAVALDWVQPPTPPLIFITWDLLGDGVKGNNGFGAKVAREARNSTPDVVTILVDTPLLDDAEGQSRRVATFQGVPYQFDPRIPDEAKLRLTLEADPRFIDERDLSGPVQAAVKKHILDRLATPHLAAGLESAQTQPGQPTERGFTFDQLVAKLVKRGIYSFKIHKREGDNIEIAPILPEWPLGRPASGTSARPTLAEVLPESLAEAIQDLFGPEGLSMRWAFQVIETPGPNNMPKRLHAGIVPIQPASPAPTRETVDRNAVIPTKEVLLERAGEGPLLDEATELGRGVTLSAGLETAKEAGVVILSFDIAAHPALQQAGLETLTVAVTPTDAQHSIALGIPAEKLIGILWAGLEEKDYLAVDSGIRHLITTDPLAAGWRRDVASVISGRLGPGYRVITVYDADSLMAGLEELGMPGVTIAQALQAHEEAEHTLEQMK